MKPTFTAVKSVEPGKTPDDSRKPPASRKILVLIGWLLLCLSSSITAIFVSTDGWFAGLHKPTWNPPSWLFGPVWTILYILMAVAAWRVWCRGGWTVQKGPLGIFFVQWALNALWTPLFFGMHQPGVAFADIISLLLMLAVTIVVFWRVEKMAGLLLIPYLAWVTFATALNFTIWRLNT